MPDYQPNDIHFYWGAEHDEDLTESRHHRRRIQWDDRLP
jgi:hypothetical protein